MPVPKILSIGDVARLKTAPAGPVLLHLTQAQLENTLAQARRRAGRPRRAGEAFTIQKLADGGALLSPFCRGRTPRACDSRIEFVNVPALRKPLARYICNCLKAAPPKLLPCYVNWIKVGSIDTSGCFAGSCGKCSFSYYWNVWYLTVVCECHE